MDRGGGCYLGDWGGGFTWRPLDGLSGGDLNNLGRGLKGWRWFFCSGILYGGGVPVNGGITLTCFLTGEELPLGGPTCTGTLNPGWEGLGVKALGVRQSIPCGRGLQPRGVYPLLLIGSLAFTLYL